MNQHAFRLVPAVVLAAAAGIAIGACSADSDTGNSTSSGSSTTSSSSGGSGGSSTGGSGGSSTGGSGASSTGGSGGSSNGGNGGAGGAGGSDPGLAPQCNITPNQSTLCIENASGRPGDTIDMDVYVLAPAGCTDFNQATATVDSLEFGLANAQDDDGPAGICKRRELCLICNPSVFGWAELPASAIGGTTCPEVIPIGQRDTFQVTIAVGTPLGDYPLTNPVANIIGNQAACGGSDIGGGAWESTSVMGPTIRVY